MEGHVVARRALRGAGRLDRLLVLAAVIGALAALAAVAIPAQGGLLQYCSVSRAPGATCEGPNHSLTGNEAFNANGYWLGVCAGAVAYGSYICGGFGYAEHCYSGNNVLVPSIANDDSVTQNLYGWEYYGVDPCP